MFNPRLPMPRPESLSRPKSAPNTELWIVGKLTPEKHERAFEFQGVFSSKDLAIKACRTPMYFIAPATLDVEVPDETLDWPGLVYPSMGELVDG